jgi:hypothetical protein
MDAVSFVSAWEAEPSFGAQGERRAGPRRGQEAGPWRRAHGRGEEGAAVAAELHREGRAAQVRTSAAGAAASVAAAGAGAGGATAAHGQPRRPSSAGRGARRRGGHQWSALRQAPRLQARGLVPAGRSDGRGAARGRAGAVAHDVGRRSAGGEREEATEVEAEERRGSKEELGK